MKILNLVGELLLEVPGDSLVGANLSGADLRRADMREANLSGADLRRADMREADLSWANLGAADLRWADLSGADLRRANLSLADLSWANLRSADLRWADLSGANLDLSSGVPFCCGGTGIKGDHRLFSQMIYHLTRQDWSSLDEECKNFLASIPESIVNSFCKYRNDVRPLGERK
jgi:uncharacterized protein YjbI with pentapeptide repeats